MAFPGYQEGNNTRGHAVLLAGWAAASGEVGSTKAVGEWRRDELSACAAGPANCLTNGSVVMRPRCGVAALSVNFRPGKSRCRRCHPSASPFSRLLVGWWWGFASELVATAEALILSNLCYRPRRSRLAWVELIMSYHAASQVYAQADVRLSPTPLGPLSATECQGMGRSEEPGIARSGD